MLVCLFPVLYAWNPRAGSFPYSTHPRHPDSGLSGPTRTRSRKKYDPIPKFLIYRIRSCASHRKNASSNELATHYRTPLKQYSYGNMEYDDYDRDRSASESLNSVAVPVAV
jgi:hypothetical protein